MLRFIKSPIGLALGAAALILAVSPEARKATRKLAVKATAGLLVIGDKVQAAASGAKEQWEELVKESRSEKEPIVIMNTDTTVHDQTGVTKQTDMQNVDNVENINNTENVIKTDE